MKLRIFYTLMADDNSVLDLEKSYIDLNYKEPIGFDYCSEQRKLQAILDRAISRYRIADKVYVPVIQNWIRIN